MIDDWEQGQDLNLRPSGYEPDELPDCSTLLQVKGKIIHVFIKKAISNDNSSSRLDLLPRKSFSE